MNGFTFYREYYDMIQRLKKPQDRANLSLAVMEFVFEDKMPKNLSDAVQMAFEILLPKLSKSKNNSGRGGRPKTKTETKNGFEKLKPNCKSVSNRFSKIETERETVPDEKESTKEKEATLEREILERKKENYINNNYQSVPTHEEIMRDFGISDGVITTMQDFLRHCYLNGVVVSNAKLEDILFRLVERYGQDAMGMNECINTAIRGGYVDIRA